MRSSLMLLSVLSFSSLSAQTWRVDPKPVISIGTSDLSGSELLKVTSAHRLADGRIVVTNGDPREVRVFGKDGKLLSRFGRPGKGPGEFGYSIALLPTAGDSIVVWDFGNRRRLLFQSDGKLVKETSDPAGTSAAGQLTVFRRTLVRFGSRGQNACLLQAIAALPRVNDPVLREVFADEAGRVWSRSGSGATWALHTEAGQSLGTVTLPAGMELFQAGKDFVLGRTTDDDGFDHVRLLRATLPPAPSTRQGCVTPPPDTTMASKIVAAATKTDMCNAITASEAYFADHATYPASFEAMKEVGYQMSKAAYEGDLVVLRSSATGYRYAIFHRKSTYMCLVDVGGGGWMDGVLMCGF